MKKRRNVRNKKKILAIFTILIILLVVTCSFEINYKEKYGVVTNKESSVGEKSNYNSEEKIINTTQTSRDNSMPEFYGTTGINLKVGDKLDLENVMFKIYAKDYYDGDLTHNITIIKNDVNTEVEGKYHIVYSVKNSQDIQNEIEVPVNITSNGERLIKRKLYSTKYGWNTNVNKGAGNKGVNHDRQHLGIYVKAGATLKIRQTQESYDKNNKIKVDILNNDKNTESLDIAINTTNENTNNWQEIVIKNDSVPFINTIDTTEEINQEIEINIEDVYNENLYIKSLTYFLEGDDESNFIKNWGTNQDSFALLESDRITLLTPIEDIDIIRDIINNTSSFKYPFKSLADLFMYYDDVFTLYDQLIGLDFNAVEEIDKNERTKYFVKADMNGVGLAYYSNNYTAQNSNSISEYLQKNMGKFT